MNSSVFTKSPEDYKIRLNELNILPSFRNSSTDYIVLYLKNVSCSGEERRKGLRRFKVPFGLLCDFGQVTDHSEL